MTTTDRDWEKWKASTREFWRTHASCPNCGAVRNRAIMDYRHVEDVPPGHSVEDAYDLIDDFFCRGIYTGKWTTDPCDPDAYESCYELYCEREGIEL